jgi:hypothetical protein
VVTNSAQGCRLAIEVADNCPIFVQTVRSADASGQKKPKRDDFPKKELTTKTPPTVEPGGFTIEKPHGD